MKNSRRRGGFTLLEIMIALSILVLSIIGLISVISYTTTQNEINRENLLAMRAAEGKIEEMRQYDVTEIFARYSATAATKSFLVAGNSLAGAYLGPDFSDLFDPTKPGYDPAYQRIKGAQAHIEFPWLNKTLVGGAFGTDSNYYAPPPAGNIALHEESDPLIEPDQIARDLNGDGNIADNTPNPNSPTEDYVLLPTKITISWKGIKGNRTIVYRYMFLKKT